MHRMRAWLASLTCLAMLMACVSPAGASTPRVVLAEDFSATW